MLGLSALMSITILAAVALRKDWLYTGDYTSKESRF